MLGDGGARRRRVLGRTEPPGPVVQVLRPVAELADRQAPSGQGGAEGLEHPVGGGPQRMPLRVDGQSDDVGQPHQLLAQIVPHPGQQGVLGVVLAQLVVQREQPRGAGGGGVVAQGAGGPRGPLHGPVPGPRPAELIARLPGPGPAEPGDQGGQARVEVVVGALVQRLGVADLDDGEHAGPPQAVQGPPPVPHEPVVQRVLDDQARPRPARPRQGGDPLHLGLIGGPGEGHADEGVGGRQRGARPVQGELGGGGGLQGERPGARPGRSGRLGPAGLQRRPGLLAQVAHHRGGVRIGRLQRVQAPVLALVEGAGGQLGQGVTARPGDVGDQCGVAVGGGPRQGQGAGAPGGHPQLAGGLLRLLQGGVGHHLQGVGVEQLVVPPVLPGPVGLDLPQPLQIERGAVVVGDVEEDQIPLPGGGIRPVGAAGQGESAQREPAQPQRVPAGHRRPAGARRPAAVRPVPVGASAHPAGARCPTGAEAHARPLSRAGPGRPRRGRAGPRPRPGRSADRPGPPGRRRRTR